MWCAWAARSAGASRQVGVPGAGRVLAVGLVHGRELRCAPSISVKV